MSMLEQRFLGFVCAMLAALCIAAPAAAQAPAADPPGRVARVADTFGQVWLYSPETGEWIGAQRNRPVTRGDRIATDAGARVELALGSTTLRLDADSELEVLELDDDRVALRLHSGSAAARVRDARALGAFEVLTNEGRMQVQAAGRYRFDSFDHGSDLTVDAGQAQFEGPGNGLTVHSGQRGEFWLGPNGAAQYSLTEPQRDAFASWVAERDRNQDRLAAAVPRYISPEMTGAQDLDRYGRWEQSPDYGPIWYPRGVVAGWAPYSAGHWAWVRPWGWTWVDDAPWGFAPFHYGRWVYHRNNWAWAPGTYVARPVYAPALVAWIGGPRLSVSVTIGSGPAVGWFPLAPREVYVPAYHASPRYVREVNVTHITNVTVINNPPRDYRNRQYPHAVTVVPASVLTNRQEVAPSAARFRNLPPVRAAVAQPAQVSATLTPPVAAPQPSQRGLEARPFRPREAGRDERRDRPGTAQANPSGPGATPASPGVMPSERRGERRESDRGDPRGPDRREGGPGARSGLTAPTPLTQPAAAVPVRPAMAEPPRPIAPQAPQPAAAPSIPPRPPSRGSAKGRCAPFPAESASGVRDAAAPMAATAVMDAMRWTSRCRPRRGRAGLAPGRTDASAGRTDASAGGPRGAAGRTCPGPDGPASAARRDPGTAARRTGRAGAACCAASAPGRTPSRCSRAGAASAASRRGRCACEGSRGAATSAGAGRGAECRGRNRPEVQRGRDERREQAEERGRRGEPR